MYKLKLLGKMEQFYEELIPFLKRFPKSQKYTLGQEIEKETLSCVKLIFSASYERDSRMKNLSSLRVSFHLLNFLIRAARKSGCISEAIYEKFCRELDEMGKMSSQWIKTEGMGVKSKAPVASRI